MPKTSPPAQVEFHPEIPNLHEWGGITGIPCQDAGILKELEGYYTKAKPHLLDLSHQLIGSHGFHQDQSEKNAHYLFAIERESPYKSEGGHNPSPDFRLRLPSEISSFFLPERRTEWQMIFHGAVFPAMRFDTGPVKDLLCFLQCIAPGLVVLSSEDDRRGKVVTQRALPNQDWVKSKEKVLRAVFGDERYHKLETASGKLEMSFRNTFEPDSDSP
ncbi:hypothetical protein BD410DRAFT_778446 [Rickenella mellea]|uniref:Uncharacterized protein n=1 Tax=Rickenella mellea TaxID=50990 RepID=A0A4Y7PJM0_9AGAM|nr:hypothetical protein BD410DRAFT_778446 [Rickenella mellea]